MPTAIGLRFLAGRYHATPWGRHVNEGAVEWPPSPWRVLRGMLATWHRKVAPGIEDDAELERLLSALASDRPHYVLPRATHTHTRHYVPVASGRSMKPTLVFDAWLSIDRDSELVMVWPNITLEPGAEDLLRRLMHGMGYLGRAESWTEARVLDEWVGTPNCTPAQEPSGTPGSQDRVPTYVPMSPESFRAWRDTAVQDADLEKKKLKKFERKLLASLPERLIDALRIENDELRSLGWSRAPGSEVVDYLRPAELLTPDRSQNSRRFRVAPTVTTVRFVLGGKPLPRIEDAVRIGELVRRAAMSRSNGEEALSSLSGHDREGALPHSHAFYLPEDADGDGKIDHVLVHVGEGINVEGLAALRGLKKIWEAGGGEWPVVLERAGRADAFRGHPLVGPARTWTSVTPYLHPWYRKKGFSVEDQIRRECDLRGLPSPTLRRLDHVSVLGQPRRPVQFRRFRSRRGLSQPDRQGSFWELAFPTPVSGPLALGFGCHYGLGMFRRDEGAPDD